MKARANLRGIFLTLLLCALALAFATCGGSSHRVAPARQSGGQAIQAAVDVSLDEALAELDALPTPDGVNPALFAELKDALASLLESRFSNRDYEDGSGGLQATTPLIAQPGDCASSVVSTTKRIVSSPPTGAANRIDDLACFLSDENEYGLSWLYRNCGDYDQNGAVGIEDITPLAMHFAEDTTLDNEWIDGDLDGRVHISDITPIAMNFGAKVHHYSVQGSHFFSSQFTETTQLVFPENAPNDARLTLEHSLGAEPEYLYWRVVPVDDEGNPGDASNTVEVSAAPPPPVRILSINPLGGVTGTEVTFSAVITGEAPFDYQWNFGGGADPNESTVESPTVTLGAVGTYDAQLFVENAEGSAVKHFTLTVSAEPGNPPEIISASPTEGDSGTEVTFTAEVTGDAPFEYYWDFAGGASPNQSSGVSNQPSATVTLTRGGTLPEPVHTYPASLTVTNSSGMTTHDFSLNVSAWWHVEEIPYVPYRTKSSVVSPKFSRDGVLCGASKYTDDNEDGVIAYERLESGVWIVESAAVGNYEPYYSDMGFAFDSMDNPAISWGDYNDGAVHFAVKREGVWQHEIVAPGGLFAPRTELFFDSQDRAVISFSYFTGIEDEVARKIVRETSSGWDAYDRPRGFVAPRPNCNVLVAYNTEDHHQLLLAELENSDWSHNLVYEAQGDEWTGPYGIAVDSDGMARILHTGGSSVGLQMAREQSGEGFELEPVESYPNWIGMVTFLALLPDNTELLTFTHYYGDEQPVVGWRDVSGWHYDESPIPGQYANPVSILVHPAGYPVLISRTQMAAYW